MELVFKLGQREGEVNVVHIKTTKCSTQRRASVDRASESPAGFSYYRLLGSTSQVLDSAGPGRKSTKNLHFYHVPKVTVILLI